MVNDFTDQYISVLKGNTSDLQFSIDKIIVHISQFVTLNKIGDLIFTVTPESIGLLAIGEKLYGTLSVVDFFYKVSFTNIMLN